jgi:hypothetical protein
MHAMPAVRQCEHASPRLVEAVNATYDLLPLDSLDGTPVYDAALRWSRIKLPDTQASYRDSTVMSSGWPMRAMWMSEERSGFDGVSSSSRRRFDSPWGTVPLGIHPLGFAADSLLFGFPLVALALLPWGVRRCWRARRGTCVRCGYDLGGLPRNGSRVMCPECGRNSTCPAGRALLVPP